MATQPISAPSFTSPTASSNNSSSSSSNSATGSAPNKEMFLQLLVAQLKNQDPTNPTDGTQFVAQLAQFSQLEQMIAIRQDADQIATQAKNATAGNAPTSAGLPSSSGANPTANNQAGANTTK